MKLIDVLDSELREEVFRRWKVAKDVAKRVNGVIYGSMAAMVMEGLPRLPRDADIAVGWSLDKFLEWFRIFEQENWFENLFVSRRVFGSTVARGIPFCSGKKVTGSLSTLRRSALNQTNRLAGRNCGLIRLSTSSRRKGKYWKEILRSWTY